MVRQRETRIRRWMRKHGVLLSPGTKGERRFQLPGQEVKLPRYRYDRPPVMLRPPAPRRAGWTRERTGRPFGRVDLVGWEQGSKSDTLVVAELKVSGADEDDVLQLTRYVNYAEWLLHEMPYVELGMFRSEDLEYPTLKGSPRIMGLLLAREFDMDIHWSFPYHGHHEVLLVRYAVTDDPGKPGIADITFFDETQSLAKHWQTRGEELRKGGK